MTQSGKQLRAGVVGAGVFGGYHASKYATHGDTQLIGIFDPEADRMATLAERFGARTFDDVDALLLECDVVTVASPARTHAELALRAMDAGVHVLVEKPVATTMDDADALVAKADETGVRVQAGHQERFVFSALGVFDIDEPPKKIVARRCNPFSPRGADVSVSLDLMTHDIDLARILAQRAHAVSAKGEARRVKTEHADVLDAVIEFENGIVAEFTASRVADDRDRVMRLEYPSGVIEVDFVAKTLGNTTEHPLNEDFADNPEAKDSLGASVDAFVRSVLRGEAPAISIQDGAEAVRLALLAEQSIVAV